MRLEAKIEERAAHRAWVEHGVPSVKFIPWGETGLMDRWFFLPEGRPLLVEFKQPGEELKPKQAFWRARLLALGYDVIDCDDVEKALEAIRARLRARGY